MHSKDYLVRLTDEVLGSEVIYVPTGTKLTGVRKVETVHDVQDKPPFLRLELLGFRIETKGPEIATPQSAASKMTLSELQRLVYSWAVRCFGQKHMDDQRVRALRLLEEAIEFAQAAGVEADQARELIAHVYDKIAGHPFQELGGVGVTWLAAVSSIGAAANDVLGREVDRILSKPPEHFAKRNQVKCEAGFR